jgi:hypothetical protein
MNHSFPTDALAHGCTQRECVRQLLTNRRSIQTSPGGTTKGSPALQCWVSGCRQDQSRRDGGRVLDGEHVFLLQASVVPTGLTIGGLAFPGLKVLGYLAPSLRDWHVHVVGLPEKFAVDYRTPSQKDAAVAPGNCDYFTRTTMSSPAGSPPSSFDFPPSSLRFLPTLYSV